MLQEESSTLQNIVVFYLMRPLDMRPNLVQVESAFKFVLFLPDQLVTQALDAIKVHLKQETFDVWFFRGSLGAVMYVAMFAIFMYWLSIWIMKPIVQFTRVIEINIEQVRKLKQGKSEGKKLQQIQM